jgi:hypothetical protein
MINHGSNSDGFNEDKESDLCPPRFDESATADARPVRPIPANRVSDWYSRTVFFLRQHTGRWKALVLVVIAGLITGTFGGVIWAKRTMLAQPSPAAIESESGAAPMALQAEVPQADVTGATDILSSGSRTTRVRNGRSRVRLHRVPRAYRVAVLR